MIRRRLLLNFALHTLACVLFVLLNDYAVSYYKQNFGGFTARGVAAGMVAWGAWYLLIIFSIPIAMIMRLRVRLLLTLAQAALILYWLMPEHPVRALFYASLNGSLTLMAVLLSEGIGRHLKPFVSSQAQV
ncbi:MAG: hypothetical protein RR736_05935 [Pseudomonas sp.]|uniref:hypothetical protein n=1 Tax=Pseudomonas TaxID=286 RepID=UPI0019400A75|nr:hypothetical protein [Pseudomonas arcuscaelestis]MBM3104840.1 hypothetical protein [Pseudomonas arcuscaelestis]